MKAPGIAAFWLSIIAAALSNPLGAWASGEALCVQQEMMKFAFPYPLVTRTVTERHPLQVLDRKILKAVQKGGKQYSYIVDSSGAVHVFEGRSDIPEDALWIIENLIKGEKSDDGKPLQKFIVQEAGDLVYAPESRSFSLQSRYKLDGSEEGKKDAIAFVQKEFPEINLSKSLDPNNSYEKVISCLDFSNKEHAGESFVKTSWSSGNINFAMWETAFNPLDNVCDWEMAAADYLGMAVRSPTSALLSRKLVLDGASSLKLFSSRLSLGAVHVGTQSGINHAVAAGGVAAARKLSPEEEKKFEECKKRMSKQGTYNWGSLVLRSGVGFMADQYLLNDAHRALFDACKKGGIAKLIITPTVMRLVEKNAMNAIYWIPRKLYLED
ncbi:MAG TPA: hypothetical protein DCS07_12865 [Bdellovibrionales bacterium]|nr:MAG: hypothetical protein A2Z97_13745 [Bdellovibrionales bacterium GWB1_52_6]OFZ06176.1 MAG: hypothetical protein A2X97_08980 [Bdellovibrionales bacterium GWA1_52_35]OFZ40166.1 MAG: hypothetical protein A2070_02390 [Bdellovibrionales bacterium GWC1_52_8]HAR43503.1 hypothetical protein [Bdellovibrionales bacterium]HCM41182.1 hypothetical protein [Bdellovibrionales bacterium]